MSLLEFPAGRISVSRLKDSSIPPFITNFFEFYVPGQNAPIDKKDFEEILNKAIVFNINYIIRPKNTILKFLFGDMETRPVHFIHDRLRYFQFYGYYIMQIEDFINLNSLEVVSYEQIELLLNEVNKRIYEEIFGRENEAHRMSLVKLLYYFFHDLGENNPINIKLPKKILSAYFYDKGYFEIKKRVDSFFSEEIFIQEAIELMDPGSQKAPRRKTDTGISDEQIKEMVSKAKTQLISKTVSDREVEKILQPEERFPAEIPEMNIKLIREQESQKPEAEKIRLIIDDEIYSDDLMFAAHFSDMAPPVILSSEDERKKLIDDLFCEDSYRVKIIRKLFKKSEEDFIRSVNRILDMARWQDATGAIEEIFKTRKINYFSEEAVKFVDIMQSHFSAEENILERKTAGN
jgi:hypothetical protein